MYLIENLECLHSFVFQIIVMISLLFPKFVDSSFLLYILKMPKI